MDVEPSAPAQEGLALFTPWHDRDEASPYPAEGQWYFTHRLSQAPEAAELAMVEADDVLLTQALSDFVGLSPLDTEDRVEELVEVAARSPRTLDALLDHEDGDVRWAAARLLYRLVLESARDEDAAAGGRLAALAARHLRDDSEEVSLLLLDCVAEAPVAWTTPRLVKTFGLFDNHSLVVLRARAAAHLLRRGSFGGMPLLLKILKEQTPLQENIKRDWNVSPRTAWWKEEALAGIEAIAGERFGSSPDASPAAQAEAVTRIEAWWEKERAALWSEQPALDDPQLLFHVRDLILALGTFQLRNVDNAEFILTRLGPPVAPHLLEAMQSGKSCAQVRRHCIEILKELMDDVPPGTRREWVDAMTVQLLDPDSRIAERALEAIGASLLPGVVPVLEERLHKGNAAEKELALRHLADNPAPEARQVLSGFLESLEEGDPLWIAAAAAHIASGSRNYLDRYLELLAGEDLRRARRASVYLSWIVEVDEFSTAEDAESRRSAVEALREVLEERLDP